MTEEEWLDGLKHLNDDQIVQLHFGLQEKIKKHYRLRTTGNNLQKAISLCEQQIALAPLTCAAMERQHQAKLEEVNAIREENGMPAHEWSFELPSHHGYRQLSVILRRQKDLDRLVEIETKRKSEGWAD